MADSVWVGGGWIGHLDRCYVKYVPLLWIPAESRPSGGGFLLPVCPEAHLMVSSMDWLSRSWNWPQLAHPLVQEEMDAKRGTNMNWNKMVQTTQHGCYVQNVLWPKVSTGIFSSSPHCVGEAFERIYEHFLTETSNKTLHKGKGGIFYSQKNFCPTYFCFTAEVRALMELTIWSNNTVT